MSGVNPRSVSPRPLTAEPCPEKPEQPRPSVPALRGRTWEEWREDAEHELAMILDHDLRLDPPAAGAEGGRP